MRPGADTASIAGDLMLAPMVALMRLPLMATETQHGTALRTETNRAVSEKLAAVAEGVMSAQISVMQSALRFWPEILSGRVPSVLTGVAIERSMQAALKPASLARQGELQAIIPELKRKSPKTAKTVFPGEHGFAIRNAWLNAYAVPGEEYGSGTRDLIRSVGRIAITASFSVLVSHRYRAVIESLSKPKFAAFLT